MVTAAGSGYSRWRGLDVTRWREDTTRDPWGTYLLPDRRQSGRVWSAGYQPAGVEPDTYEAVYSEDRVEIHRRDGPIATSLRILVSTEDDAEMRQVSLTNFGRAAARHRDHLLRRDGPGAAGRGRRPPGVLEPLRPDGVRAGGARRCSPAAGRATGKSPVWAAQVMTAQGEMVGTVQYETDRARFLGRGRSIRNPTSIEERRPLSNTVGTVLDPFFSLRRRVRLGPGATARVQLATVVADSREEALALADKYRDPGDVRPRREPRLDAGAGPAASPRRSRPTRRTCSSGWRHGSSTPTRPCALPPRPSSATARAPPPSGATGSPATSRSCSCGSTRSRTRGSCASSCAPTSTGG